MITRRTRKNFLTPRRKRLLIIAAIVLAIVAIAFSFFGRKILSAIFTIMLLVLGCMSSQFKRMLGNIQTGIEFIPFVTIIFFFTHGFTFGIFAAFLMMVVSTLLVGELQMDLFVSLGIFALVGLIGIFLPLEIVMFGYVLIVAFNIISLVVLTVLGFDPTKNIIYFFGSIIFNVILFKYFSEIIVKVLLL